MYSRVKSFCNDRNLTINLDKTQLIIFKPIRRELPVDFGIPFDNVTITPSTIVKLLGVTLDHHFTMGPHIDDIVKKCHGLLGMLKRSAAYLPQDLLKLVYTALIRSHLEYCSATFFKSANTHLNKLDVIQKIALRIITGSTPQTHSAPLQLQLGLDSLTIRRRDHVISLVENVMKRKAHPHFNNYFRDSANSDMTASSTTNNSTRVATRPATGKLVSKMFLNYGLSTLIDQHNSEETTCRPLDHALMGHVPDFSNSQLTSPTYLSSSACPPTIQPQMPGPGSSIKMKKM